MFSANCYPYLYTCTSEFEYEREDNDSNVLVINTWLIWIKSTSIFPKNDVKLNHSLTLTPEAECL